MRTTLEKNLFDAIAQPNSPYPNAVNTPAATCIHSAICGDHPKRSSSPATARMPRPHTAYTSESALSQPFAPSLDRPSLGAQLGVTRQNQPGVDGDHAGVEGGVAPGRPPVQPPRRAEQE